MFLDFFSDYSVNEVDIVQMSKDLASMPKEDFLNTYTKKSIYWNTHDFRRHITWFTYDKIFLISKGIGFKDVIVSSKSKSISNEMRAKQFDTVNETMSFYVDIIK